MIQELHEGVRSSLIRNHTPVHVFMCASMYRHMLLGPALASYPVRDHSYVMQNPACHWAQLRQILLYSSNTKLGHNLYAWL